MNEKEKQIINDISYEGLSKLDAEEIGQIIKESIGIPESYKLESVLFTAIVQLNSIVSRLIGFSFTFFSVFAI